MNAGLGPKSTSTRLQPIELKTSLCQSETGPSCESLVVAPYKIRRDTLLRLLPCAGRRVVRAHIQAMPVLQAPLWVQELDQNCRQQQISVRHRAATPKSLVYRQLRTLVHRICDSYSSWIDSMIDIFVDPTDWGGGFIVVTNVAHQLAREILYRSEDTSGNNVTLNLGEPNFDLVKPTGVGRGIVDSNCGVSLKKFKDFLRLVRA